MKVTHVIVKGLVQGVFFRDYTRREACDLNLVGWVRNLRDGTVEVAFSGADHDVTAMLEWLRKGSPRSRVDDLIVKTIETDEYITTFDVRFDPW